MLALAIFIVGILADLFFYNTESDIRFLLLGFLWIVILKVHHYSSNATFKLAIGFLAVMYFFFTFEPTNVYVTERAGSWLYIFLFIGIMHQVAIAIKEESTNSL